MGKCGKTAETVVDDTDVHAGGGFLLQDIKDRPPHYPIVDDKIFDIYIMLCLFQLLHQDREHIVSHLKIFRSSILIYREPGITVDVFRLNGGGRAGLCDLLHDLRILLKIRHAFLLYLRVMFLHLLGDTGFTEQDIKDKTENRHRHDQHGPSQFIGRIDPPVHDPQHDKYRNYSNTERNIF